MKNFCISLVCLSIIVLTVILGANRPVTHEEYLRIHVRANSNSVEDQGVKQAVKDAVVSYLTPVVAECKSKKALQNALESHIEGLEATVDSVLLSRGFGYKGEAILRKEEFPTRVYGELTLEAGYYDALIVNLGEGKGDNWWCVVYPPLCFTGQDTGDGFRYASKIAEIISCWRERYGK